MLSNPVADDMGLYWRKKGGAKACFVNVEAVDNIASNNRGTKVRKCDGGSTVRCARNGIWGRDVDYATIRLMMDISEMLSWTEMEEIL